MRRELIDTYRDILEKRKKSERAVPADDMEEFQHLFKGYIHENNLEHIAAKEIYETIVAEAAPIGLELRVYLYPGDSYQNLFGGL